MLMAKLYPKYLSYLSTFLSQDLLWRSTIFHPCENIPETWGQLTTRGASLNHWGMGVSGQTTSNFVSFLFRKGAATKFFGDPSRNEYQLPAPSRNEYQLPAAKLSQLWTLNWLPGIISLTDYLLTDAYLRLHFEKKLTKGLLTVQVQNMWLVHDGSLTYLSS